jgi:flagellar basal-body rod protein FlgB
MSDLLGKTGRALQSTLNMRQLKHAITSANIANAETPGFHAKKIDFEDALARQIDIDGLRRISTSHPEHVPVGGDSGKIRLTPQIYDNPEGEISNDGNTVDLDKEMTTLTENSIQYRAALQLINKKLAALKYAANEGR